MIGCHRHHHTAQNLLANGECVLNFPGQDIVKKVWDANKFLEPSTDELALKGFTTIPSSLVNPPRLKECRAHIECQLESVKWYDDDCVLLW